MDSVQTETAISGRPEGLLQTVFRSPVMLYRLGLSQFFPPLFVMMTAPGRKTGLLRHAPVECRAEEDRIWVISAYGEKAHWYRNVTAQERITLQRGGEAFAAGVRALTDPDETLAAALRFEDTMGEAAFSQTFGRWLGVPVDADRATREAAYGRLRVVEFTRLPGEPLPFPPVEADLRWVWPLVAATFALGVLAGWLLGNRRSR